MQLFVGGISFNLKEENLKEVFEKFGTVNSVRIITDKFTGRPKGYGFIEMATEEGAKKAVEALNDTELDGRNIGVKIAEERAPRTDGPRRDFKKRDNNRW